MRPWAWVRRVLALALTFVFVLGILVTPAFAATKSRSFSAPKSSGYSSGSRSYSAPKPSTTPKTTTPSRSFSTPKPSTSTPSTPSRSFSSPAPSGTTQPSKGYTAPSSQGYSSGDRSYSSPDRSFSSQRPSVTVPSGSGSNGSTPVTPAPSYDTGKTRYPSYPPVVIYGPSPFDAPYWHDWYYGRPFWWRMLHRPVYYGTDGGWAINWWPAIIIGGIVIWFLLGVLSAYTTRRRRP